MTTIEVDEGWAWAVPIGGFIANFIVGGLAKSFGILINAYIELFNCSSASMTVAGGLIYTFMYTLSIGSHYLCIRFGSRVIIAIGGLGASASLIGASFAPSVGYFIAFLGGGLGVSLSMIYSPIFVMVGRSFRRYAGVANGVSVAGVSVGQILFPYIVTVLIEEYTARGATMIGGGICLNFLVTAALMPRYVNEPETKSKEVSSKEDPSGLRTGDRCSDVQSQENKALMNGASHKEKDMEDVEDRNTVPSVEVENPEAEMKTYPQWLSTRLLIVFICAKLFADIGDVGEAFVLPTYGKQLNFTPQEISLAISISGIVDLVARLFIGWFSDRPGTRRSLILFFAWIVEGFNSLFISYHTSFAVFCTAYGIFGVCSGTAMTLMVVVLTDFVGPPNLPKSFAIMMVLVGLLIAAGQFLIGHIYDITRGYEWSLRAIAIMMIYSAFVLLFEFPLRWYYQRHRPDKKLSSSESRASPCRGDGVEYELTPPA